MIINEFENFTDFFLQGREYNNGIPDPKLLAEDSKCKDQEETENTVNKKKPKTKQN